MIKFTSAAGVRFVSLENFIANMVAVKYVEVNEKYEVNYFERTGVVFSYGLPMDIDEKESVELKEKYTILVPCYEKMIKNFKEDFIESLITEEHEAPDDFYWELEDKVVRSAVECGQPEFAVNIGTREWALVDPKDFIIYKTPDNLRGRLVCLNKTRNFIYKYGKRNEK